MITIMRENYSIKIPFGPGKVKENRENGPGKMTFGPGKVLEKSWNFFLSGWWEP